MLMKRIIALVIGIMLALCALPAMAEAEFFTSSTPIYFASDAQLINIQKAVDALNGWYIPDGSYFSFNDAVGPRTSETGYVDAKNGRGSSVAGGGVSQVATTMYLALLQIPGVQYAQITTYGDRFTAGYVSDGALAVVTDHEAAVDFAFANNSGQDLTLRIWEDGVFLYCELATGIIPGTAFDAAAQVAVVSSASFTISNSSGLVTNITRAAENAACVVLEPGMEYSFNGLIGPRTEQYGFVSAVNGRGVNVIGGGVAQVASVLWLAVKDVDTITVTDKSTYGSRYNQDYVASSDDAIVTDYKAGTDFAFRNDGPDTITVCLSVTDNVLSCDIYEGAVDPAGITDAAPVVQPTEKPKQSGGLNW